jgi:hypothetical protein
MSLLDTALVRTSPSSTAGFSLGSGSSVRLQSTGMSPTSYLQDSDSMTLINSVAVQGPRVLRLVRRLSVRSHSVGLQYKHHDGTRLTALLLPC